MGDLQLRYLLGESNVSVNGLILISASFLAIILTSSFFFSFRPLLSASQPAFSHRCKLFGRAGLPLDPFPIPLNGENFLVVVHRSF